MPLSFAHRDPVQTAAPVRPKTTDMAEFIERLTRHDATTTMMEEAMRAHQHAVEQKALARTVQVTNELHKASKAEVMRKMQAIITQMEWNSKTKEAVLGTPVVNAEEVLDAYDKGEGS